VPQKADEMLTAMKETREGKDAQMVGEATGDFDEVALKTPVGRKGFSHHQ